MIDKKLIAEIKRNATPEEWEEFISIRDEARESDVPFLAAEENNSGLMVVGNPNNTEVKHNDYTLEFRMPVSLFEGEDALEYPKEYIEVGTGMQKSLRFKKTYKDVFLSPRKNTKIMNSFMKLAPFFVLLKDDGKLTIDKDGEKSEINLTHEEMAQYMSRICDDTKMQDGFYDVVQAFLDVDLKELDYAYDHSILTTFFTFLKNHPDIVNQFEELFT